MKKLIALTTVLMLISLSTSAMEWQADDNHFPSPCNEFDIISDQKSKLFALFAEIEKNPNRITIKEILDKKVAEILEKYKRKKHKKLLRQK